MNNKVSPSIDDVLVIVPNMGFRYSGITSTAERVLPIQSRTLPIATMGRLINTGNPKLGFGNLSRLWTKPKGAPFRIWHARRNDDMFIGLFLRDVLRMPLAVIFTSAAQRDHTWLTRALISRVDGVIATSPQSASYLTRPATVIQHGIDISAFHPAQDKAELRARYGLPNRLLIGCFGRVRHSKGTDVFAEAVMALARKGHDVAGVITGLTKSEDAAFQKKIRDSIADSGMEDRFHWLGEVPRGQMADMFRCLDIFCAPQRQEGFGVTPLEAMASCVPVAATTAGTFTAQIAEGETGYIVPCDDLPAMTAALEKLAADPELRLAMGKAGRERVGERYRIEDEAEAINRFYRSLWETGRR